MEQIHEMHLNDHFGHATVIQFRNVIMNASLSPALFIFKAA